MRIALGLALLPLAFGCDDLGTSEPAATQHAALDAGDVVFVGKKLGADYGDFVVTANPKVTIQRLDDTTTVATFARTATSPNTERIKAVLQDDAGDPADTDFDLNPVGYFQVRWATTAAMANESYRIQVTVPDGRVVGQLDVLLATRARDIPANKVGFVAGKNIQLRFRIDSDTVDRDHDGILDWGDNCPEAPNHDQADADDDGLGDACECHIAQCPVGQRFDEATCGCACALCAPGHVLLDPNTCTCGCDPATTDTTCADLPAGFVLDPVSCECACPDLACPSGRVADPDKCACVCAPGTCTAPQVQDPDTCACACPQVLEAGALDLCKEPGQVFDPVKCTCTCPTLTCLPGFVPDTDACTCRPIAAPVGPADLVAAVLRLDHPPAIEVCDGTATTELDAPLTIDKPLSRTLAFAVATDTCPESASPNAPNHADAIALPVVKAPGFDLRLDVIAEASLFFVPDCWLVVRGSDDGEVAYNASQHGGQASGGGTYLAADTADRAYVFCADRADLGVPATLSVGLTLVPR